MGTLLAKERSVVVPGEVLVEGMDYLPGAGSYRLNDKVLAMRLGLLQVDGRALKIIHLSGKYIPKRGDVIIGRIIDVAMSGWIFDTNSAYTAMLSVRDATSEFINKGADLTQIFSLGDYVVTEIVNVTSQKLVDLTTKAPGLRKLVCGRIIEVNCHKVPRIIGKQGSMVSLIKNATGCKITVGQNCLIWISGEPQQEALALEAIRIIESEAHISGLTERIQKFFHEKTGKDFSIERVERTEKTEKTNSGDVK